MANPFENRRDSECMMCERPVDMGEEMFAHDGNFICSECASEENCVCECGNYKKPEYDMCYECRFG